MIGAQVQKAIRDALVAAPPVAAGRIYDTVPTSPVFPYVSIGEEQVVDDGTACGDGWEVFADVHSWSRGVGFPEAKDLAALVAVRIRAITAVSGFSLVSIELQDQRAVRDPDGLTSHIVASFRLLLDQI